MTGRRNRFKKIILYLFFTPLLLGLFPGIFQANAAVVPNGVIIYSDNSTASTKYRTITNPTTLGAETSDGLGLATDADQEVLRAATTRMEMIAGQLHDDGKIVVRTWNGATWTTQQNVTGLVAVANTDRRPFDIEYERANGRALWVYPDDPTTGKLYYCYFDGMNWGPVSNCAPTNGTNDITLSDGSTSLTGVPTKVKLIRGDANDIWLMAEDANADLYVTKWNGTSWDTANDLVVSTALSCDDSAATLKGMCFAMGIEGNSGAPVMFYTESTNLVSRVFNGSWGNPTTEAAISSAGNWIDVDSDPGSDRLAVVSGASGADFAPRIWKADGTTAGLTTGNTDTASEAMSGRNADVAWERGIATTTRKAIFVYTDSNALVPSYETVTCTASGCTFGAITAMVTVTNCVDDCDRIQLVVNPHGDDMIMLVGDIDSEFAVYRWASGWTKILSQTVTTAGLLVDGTANANHLQFPFGYSYFRYNALSLNWRFGNGTSTANPPTWRALENATATNVAATSDKLRLRMNMINKGGANQTDSRKILQFTSSTPDDASTIWQTVGNVGGSEIFRYSDCDAGTTTCNDGVAISGGNQLTSSTVAGWWILSGTAVASTTMDHASSTTAAPNIVEVEFPIETNGADAGETYYFRMFDLGDNRGIPRFQDPAITTGCAGRVNCRYPVITIVPPAANTTLASGTDPVATTTSPETSIRDAGSFTFKTNTGVDSITSTTIILAGSGTPYEGLSEVRITSDDGATTYFSAISNPSSNTLTFSGGTPIPVSNSLVQFHIRVTPKTHANMAVPPGAEYALAPYVSAWLGTNTHAGTDSNANTLTIDNLSPNGATSASGSANNASTTISWTTSNSADFGGRSVVLRWASSTPGIEVPAEGVDYATSTTITAATVACSRIGDAASTAVNCTDTNVSNGIAYSYKIFQKDSNGNYDIGVIPTGSPLTPIEPIATLGSGTDPTNSVAPSSTIIDAGAFTFQTNTVTNSITAMNVTLANSGTPYQGVSEVRITSDNGATTYFTPITNPTDNALSFSGGTSILASTTQTQFKIRVTPKSHLNMPAPPGATYLLTPYVASWTGTYTHSGTDTNPNGLTIDNLSPNGVTSASGSANDASTTISWTTSNSADFSGRSVVLRWASSTPGIEVPAEGVDYATSTVITDATVACVRIGDGTSAAKSCLDTGVSNGTQYSYKIFEKDSNGNYDAGTIPTGSPLRPYAPYLSQENYGWYYNINSIAPTSSMAAENNSISGVAPGDVIRLRSNIKVSSTTLPAGQQFKLQYATATSGPWSDVGLLASSTIWRGYNNPNATTTDGLTLTSLLLSSSTVLETYEEENPSASSPNSISVNGYGEWDWTLEDNSAPETTTYYFRMAMKSGTALDNYAVYPTLTSYTTPSNSPYVSSTADQVFEISAPSTLVSEINIQGGAGAKGLVSSTTDARLRIPASMNATWDNSITSFTCTAGDSCSKIATTGVTYESSNKIAVINVTQNFANADWIRISGLKMNNFTAVNSATSSIYLRVEGAADADDDASDTATKGVKGKLSGQEHTMGQFANQIDTDATTATNVQVFRFKLVPTGENLNISSLAVNIPSVNGFTSSDITNAKLYIDKNSNGTNDAGDYQVGGAGTPSISGSSGNITFGSAWSVTSTIQAILQVDIAGISSGDYITFQVLSSGITTTGSTSGFTIIPIVSLERANHAKPFKTSGGSSSNDSSPNSGGTSGGGASGSGGGETPPSNGEGKTGGGSGGGGGQAP